MKKLNTEEIKQFANALMFTESEARDITNLFYNLKIEKPIDNAEQKMLELAKALNICMVR